MIRQQKFALGMTSLLLSLVVGCATTGYDRAGKMSMNMEQTRQDVLGARGQVTATFKALDTVMGAQLSDLRPLLTAYAQEVSTLGSVAEKARWRAQNIRESGATYFASWAKEIDVIQDPQLRASSMKRYNATLADYRAVEQSLIAVRDAYNPVIKASVDIQTALEHDLTAGGIAAVKPAQKAAYEKAVALQAEMTQSLAVIDRAVKSLAPMPSATR